MAQYKPKIWHGLPVPNDHATMTGIEQVTFNPRGKKLDLGVGDVLDRRLVGKPPGRGYYLVRFEAETTWVFEQDLLFAPVGR